MRANIVALLGRAVGVVCIDAVLLGGCGLVIYGVGLVYRPAGFIVAGLILILGVGLAARAMSRSAQP